MIRAVSFDLDDTFWDCAPAIRRAESALYDWHREFTPRITERYDETRLAEFRQAFRRANPELALDVSAIRKAGLKLLLEQHDYPNTLIDDAFDCFYRHRSEVDLYAGVLDLLSALKGRVRIAAITNGNADLEHIGIAHFFDLIVHASLELPPKPDPAMFDLCCGEFGIDAAELLHVGDNPEADILGAHAAGSGSVWFNQHGADWPSSLPDPHHEVRSIDALAQLLLNL